MDRIKLERVRAAGRHGAHPEERQRTQPFEIDVTVQLDLRDAAQSDDLTRTLDYAKLHARIVRIVETTSYALLERLAADLFRVVFEDARVAYAEIRIAKPGILDGATPWIVMERPNPNYRQP